MTSIILIFSYMLQIYETMILFYILMSWIPESRNSQLGRILSSAVEPYLQIFRNIIPPIGMIDISPILAYLVLRVALIGLMNLY